MENSIDKADRISRRRARIFPALAVIILIQQATFFGDGETSGTQIATRTVDIVHFWGWLAMTLLALLVLVTGGGWKYSREVRDLMNDEVARENRAKGLATGFTVAMLVTIALYALSFFTEIAAREALHIIASTGLASALLRFGLLERCALG